GVEALLCRQRRETYRIRVAEDGRRRGAAEIHVKAPPGAPVVGIGETDQTFVHAAVQAAALADRRQGRTFLDLGQGRGGARGRFAHSVGLRFALLSASARKRKRRPQSRSDPLRLHAVHRLLLAPPLVRPRRTRTATR